MPDFMLGIPIYVDRLGDGAVPGPPPQATLTFKVTARDSSSAVQQLSAALQRLAAGELETERTRELVLAGRASPIAGEGDEVMARVRAKLGIEEPSSE